MKMYIIPRAPSSFQQNSLFAYNVWASSPNGPKKLSNINTISKYGVTRFQFIFTIFANFKQNRFAI